MPKVQVNKKIWEWAEEEIEKLLEIIKEHYNNADKYIVTGSFANTKMEIADTSDIDVVVLYKAKKMGHMRIKCCNRQVSIKVFTIDEWYPNVWYGKNLSWYDLEEKKLHIGKDDCVRALQKKRPLDGVDCECSICKKKYQPDNMLYAFLATRNGIIKEFAICKYCTNPTKEKQITYTIKSDKI